MKNEIVLASSSVYRRKLLARLGIPFTWQKPPVDEEKLKKEFAHLPPQELAAQLAEAKGQSVAQKLSNDSCVIASDQLVVLGKEILGKPGTHEKALAQLQKLSSKTHQLITAVWVKKDLRIEAFQNITNITLRNLTIQDCEHVLQVDQPYDCAGGYKIEGAGLSLMQKVECEDWTAIEGLPMIQLSKVLRDLIVPLDSKKDADESALNLLKAAREVSKNAYAPYSRFQVGAALELSNGAVVTGCNVENVVNGIGICAERAAVMKMVADYPGARIRRVAVAGPGPEPLAPCGVCRQNLAEFVEDDCEVWIQGSSPKIQSMHFSELLPFTYTPKDLRSGQK